MKIRLKKALRAGGLALAAAFFLALCFSLYLYFHKPALKGYLERTLSKTPGLTVAIGRLNYRLFPLRVEAGSVKVAYVSALGRADVEIGRLRAAGSLTRVTKGRKPYLDTLDLAGLKIEFAEDPNAPSTGLVDIEGLARTISGYLEQVSRVTAGITSLHVALPVEGMDISAAGVELAGSAGQQDSISISARRLDFRNKGPEAELAAGIKLEAAWPRTGNFRLDGTVEFADSSVSLPGRKWQAGGIGLKAAFRSQEKVLAFGSLALDMPGVLALSGSATVGTGKESSFVINSRLDLRDLGRAKKTFAAFLPPDLPDFSIDGGLVWEGEVRREISAGAAQVTLDGTARMPRSRFVMERGGLSLDQVLSAEARLQGEPSRLRVKGRVDGSQGRVAAEGLRASGLSFRLPFERDGNVVKLTGFKVTAAELAVSAGGGAVKLDGLSLSGRGRFDTAGLSAAADPLTVELPLVGRIDLAGEIGSGPKPTLALSLEGRGLDIGTALGRLSASVPQAAAWQPAGQADVSIGVRNEPGQRGEYRLHGSVRMSKAAFQDASGTIVSEGLEPVLEFDASVRTPKDPVAFSLGFELAKGESLWKDAYFNWAKEPVRWQAKGEYEPGTMAVRGAGLKVLFGPLGELEASGSVAFAPRPRLAFHLAAPSVDLARLYAFLAQMSPAQASTLELGGNAAVEADVTLGAWLRAAGSVKVREARAARKDGSLLLAGMAADLPFSISNGVRPGDEKEDYSVSAGFFQVKEVKTPALSLSALRLDFYAARNLFLVFPTEVEIWGARLGLGHTALSLSPAGLGFRAASTLSLAGLDLSKLPFSSESFRLAGTADVPEGSVQISPREFRFEGRMLADLFGGKLTVDGLRVADVFTPARRIMLQAEALGLDLGKLTSSVPFGEVTGIVDVSVRDLVLSYGQPESFALTIKSVPVKGVPQKFSLKAVDNLSVISSGGPSASPSSSFLTKFVNSFNYSRMGIACSLRNDIFTLQGTIVDGGVQYLVRRATFFGIDVVNAKPVNTISFKDMLGRLERVGQSQEKK
jgi:hypothetical protein